MWRPLLGQDGTAPLPLEAGIPLALGSDSIGRAGNPWVDVFFATIDPVRPDEALSLGQAITAYTAGSADAERTEHQKGSLRPGNFADLAVLSQDVFSVPVLALPGTASLAFDDRAGQARRGRDLSNRPQLDRLGSTWAKRTT